VIENYPIIARFQARIRRPAPKDDGVMAQFFGADGPAADAIAALGRTEYNRALAHVSVRVDGEDVGGFEGEIRRPVPRQSGMIAQVLGEDGEQADVITALGLTKFYDKQALITVRLIKSFEGADQARKRKGPYGKQAGELYRCGFFNAPPVWRALGTHDDYVTWLQAQPSAYSGLFDRYSGDDGRCVVVNAAKHASPKQAEVAEYSAIPLTRAEAALFAEGDSIGDMTWYENQRMRHVQRWAHTELLEALGFESLSDVPPPALRSWAEERNLTALLPEDYR